MVQIIEAPKSFAARFSEAFTPQVIGGIQDALKRQREERLLGKESEALKEAGYNVPSDIRTKEARQALLSSQIKSKEQEAKLQSFKNDIASLVNQGVLPKEALNVSNEDLLKKMAEYEFSQRGKIADETRKTVDLKLKPVF